LFEGTLPASLGTVTMLEELYIDDNLLDGDPMAVFNGLTGALVFIANSNDFVAEIDSSFLPESDEIAQNNLTSLDLSQNSIISVAFPEHMLRKDSLKALISARIAFLVKFLSLSHQIVDSGSWGCMKTA
jgi:hypothetical protein